MRFLGSLKERFFNKNLGESQRYTAFTLYEVLIVLVILGVVAAFTIPVVLKEKDKKETITRLQKSYTVFQQSVRMAEIDNGENINWVQGTFGDAVSTRKYFDTYWAPYLRIATYCDTAQACGYKTGQFYAIDGVPAWTVETNANQTSVLLQDGSVVIVASNTWINIDINGGKGPNVFGKDLFAYKLQNGKLYPDGHSYTDGVVTWYCSKTGSHDGDGGSCCLEKIVRDNWQIKSNYPWN